MTKTNSKKALLSSVFALLICVAMLIGTTFAWFTDTASTAVNKIQAGNLKVGLEMKDASGKWVTAVDKTLNFKKAAGAETEEILWEPGCTYELPELRVVNKGNLALKYKVVISGINGSAKLNEAIEWTIGDVALGTEQHLTVGADNAFTIKGHMKENAGNEYQGLSIDGIGITVYATQDTVESDSFNNQYDKDAAYYPVIDAAGLKNALANGGNVDIATDVATDNIEDSAAARVVVSKPTTLNLDKKIISPDNMGNNNNNFAALYVDADTTINAGKDGGIDTGKNGGYGINVRNGATLTINGGYYYGGGTAVQVQKGTLVINGGTFACEPYSNPTYGYNFLINCVDSAYKDGTAKVFIKGGTFINFDPSNNTAEGKGTNFVADDYSVISETKENGDVWYTVVKGTGVAPSTQEEMNTAISESTNKDVTVVMPANKTFTLDNGLANEAVKSRNVTFVGDGSQTVDVITNAVKAEGGQLNYQRGSVFTFENTTVQAGEGDFDGIVCDELVLKNCTVKGKLTLYGKATFIDCKFENDMTNQYSIWTWGGTDVTLTNCVFNTNGKAVLLYGQATAVKPTNLTVTDCTFNDRKNGAAGKAAIEIGNDYNATYKLTVDNIKVNGFAEGKNTGSKIWANKNSMDAEHLSVTIDGIEIQ